MLVYWRVPTLKVTANAPETREGRGVDGLGESEVEDFFSKKKNSKWMEFHSDSV